MSGQTGASSPSIWSGRLYGTLVPAAEALADQHPLAASVLYRALLDDILARAKSPAYGHGAKYLVHLDLLAQQVTDWQSLPDHGSYREQIKKAHGRKLGFWSLVK
jgi:hypothetical protein